MFAGIAPQYERMSALWSFGQDARWRRFMVSQVPPGSAVLDVATGTGLVARELQKRGCR
ncbi:MAG: class I SAM-dependent methyltransferase, partial [Actinomycetota bacterium]